MPRRARLSIPGIPWHIIQRGNNRSVCFYTDEDYDYYLYHLKEQASIHGCDIHAFVLMTNHVHLLLTPEKENSASLLMKNLGQRYVQYINRTYKRSGTLWEGRFRSCLTQTDNYVLACYRYIELNPVRANMVVKPEDYKWSSYNVNALGLHSDIIVPHDQYLSLHSDEKTRSKVYKNLFKDHVSEDINNKIRIATNGNYVLGCERFQKQIEEILGRRVVRGKPGRPKQ